MDLYKRYERKADMCNSYMIEDKSLREIGKIYNLTYEAVRKIIKNKICNRKIRNKNRYKYNKEYEYEIEYQDNSIIKFLIESKKIGIKKVIIDTEDFMKIKKLSLFLIPRNDKTNNVYCAMNIKKNNKWTTDYLHRYIMGNPKELEVDHINHNTLDNRKCNLRTANRQQQSANSVVSRKNNTSGYKGVCWASANNKWVSYITINSKFVYLGYFKDKTEAAQAYNLAAKKYFGEFAAVNNIIM